VDMGPSRPSNPASMGSPTWGSWASKGPGLLSHGAHVLCSYATQSGNSDRSDSSCRLVNATNAWRFE
jgi:hypothetical protein